MAVDQMNKSCLNILSPIKDHFAVGVRFLNQPIVKEGIKNIAGTITFAIGIAEAYDLIQIIAGRKISSELPKQFTHWNHTAKKIIIVSAKISLILSAAVSRPGVFLISISVGAMFTSTQLAKVFGPNTTFILNPWHPRHIISIVAIILALPSIMLSTYEVAKWTSKKLNLKPYRHENAPHKSLDPDRWLTDIKVRLSIIFNTVTSRPVLHLGNSLGRLLLRPI